MLTRKGKSEKAHLPVMDTSKLITMDKKSASVFIDKLSSHTEWVDSRMETEGVKFPTP